MPGPPRTRWRLDLAGGALLLIGLAVALCLFSHDPADPPAPAVHPPNERPNNLLGPPGASLAHSLLRSLGLAVYVLLGAWFVLVVLLLLRRGLLTWSLRLGGWLLLVPVAAVHADRFGHGLGLGSRAWIPLTGPGGSIGAWLSLWLAETFHPVGQTIILGAALLLGLTLTADFLLPRVARAAARVCRASARLGWGLVVWWWRSPGEAEAPPRTRKPITIRHPEPDGEAELGFDAEDDGGREPDEAGTGAAPRRDIPIHYHDRPDGATGITAARPGLFPPRPAQTEAKQFADYELPSLDLLDDPEPAPDGDQTQVLRERAALLEKTFADFGLNVQVVGINAGPVVTQYEIALETGLRVHKVTRLADDVALNLKVPSVRMVAPIPGKSTVGVEMPNEHRARVRLKEVVLAAGKKIGQYKVPLFLGKDAEGRPLVQDLADMPHLLIAGSTGTGKSVCMNAIILSMLLTRRPDDVKLIMIDPKQGVELGGYSKLPHLMHPVVADMKKAEAILAWAVDKMEERYDLLRQTRVRNIAAYNQLSPDEILRRAGPDDGESGRVPTRMPYVVIIIDEMADLIMMLRKEVEGHIIRLAQKSRAAGIHLVLATQKPTVDVITGLIKSNLPARICFKVVNKSDSRVVLDAMGGDKLLGKGDMLFLPPGTSDLVRAQCTYAGDNEISQVVEFLECDQPCYAEELMQLSSANRGGNFLESLRQRDDLYEAAIEVVVREQRGSVSLLQRVLGIGYGRAARLIDFMAEDGIVGVYNGSNAREVLYTPESWDALKQETAAGKP